jgi:peptide/nickel transport system permease protein
VLGFLIRRLVWAGLLGVVITFVTFLLFFVAPGDRRSGPGQHGLIEPSLQAQFDLHGSLLVQYAGFLKHVVLYADFGLSRVAGRPAMSVIAEALPVTASLVIGGTVLWLLMAFPIGIFSALRPRSLLDKSLMLFVLIGVSAHPVWVGLMLAYFFGVQIHLFPVAGYCNFLHPAGSTLCGGPRYWTYHLVLPWITFALLFAALYARMIRASVLEALDEDYVRTARAKGAGAWRVMRRHVLRNALLPVVSMLGMDLGVAFAGALFIETVFTLPGMGSLLFRSIAAGDLPVIMGLVLTVSAAVAVANLLADIALGLLDPRIGVRGARRRGYWRERLSDAVARRRPLRGAPEPGRVFESASR